MNNESILEMFFNDVLPSIAKNELMVEDAVFNINFNTAIYSNNERHFVANIHNDAVPTLMIKNVSSFSKLLLQLINDMMHKDLKWCIPYFDVTTEEAKLKYFLSLIWSNMSANDFANVEDYLRRYISFINDETYVDLKMVTSPIAKLNNYHLEITNVEERNCEETPYALRVVVADEGNNRFVLPDVKYGIEDHDGHKRVYIYAVQYNSKMQEENEEQKKFRMKINRLLYKVDEDISKEELAHKMETQNDNHSGDENIVDVTPSALVSLTASLSLFAVSGFNDIIVPSYLPLRWDAKKIMYERRIKYYRSKGYNEEELTKMQQDFDAEQYRIARNIIDKHIRNFRRLDYHFDGIDINAYPLEVDDFMHINIGDFKAYNPDHLLGEVSDAVRAYDKGEKVL